MAKAKKAKKVARTLGKRKTSGVGSQLKSKLSGLYGLGKSVVSGAKGGRTGGHRRRVTPEKLQRQILILKLKKKLNRLKYGGR